MHHNGNVSSSRPPSSCGSRRRIDANNHSLVSMTFGRTNMVMHLSAPHILEAMGREQSACETTQERKLTFLAVCARLSIIVQQILTEVYALSTVPTARGAPTASSKTTKLMDTMLSIESKLDDFVRSLPSHLSWTLSESLDPLPPEDKSIFHIQQNVLHARYATAALFQTQRSRLVPF